jgi:tol-pal system protein YbgF
VRSGPSQVDPANGRNLASRGLLKHFAKCIAIAGYFAACADNAYDFGVTIARWIWLGLLVGCATPMSSLRDDNRRLTETVTELRSDRRTQDRKLRDLQHQLDELRVTSASRDVPALPVVIAAPGATPIASPAAAPAGPADAARVVGLADDGTEIVYEGDAATLRTVASPALPDEDSIASRRTSPPSRPPAAALSLDPPSRTASAAATTDLPAVSDRIEVTRSVPVISARAQIRGQVRGQVHGQVHDQPRDAPAERSGDAPGDYRAAVDLVKAASYVDALAALRGFIAHHPRHDYADNAQYWIGEVFYAQKDYARALVEFRKVIEVYPRGNKVPDALLKLGYCHQAMGQGEKGRAMLEQVVNRYPKSEPAMLAAKRLETP